jgi:predicted O-linked N-acetylglucosamine transferase (SPINDLY family)
MDICLDTYPYSGTTISCTAMTMGNIPFCLYNKKNWHVSNVTGSFVKRMSENENGKYNEYIGSNLAEYMKLI